jgi:hypothetical protein
MPDQQVTDVDETSARRMESVCVRTALSKLSPAGTAERYPGHGPGLAPLNRDEEEVPRIASWGIFSRPCGTGRLWNLFPGLRPGLFSAVPTGLESDAVGSCRPMLSRHTHLGAVRVNTSALDLLFLFSYIDPYAHSPFSQVLRRLLQEVRPRRVKRNGRLPCQLHLRGVLDVRRETPVSALRSNPWQAASGRPAKTRSGCCPSRSPPR